MDTQSLLYHGSPKRFRNLKPKAHYLADHRPVVFATPLREIALASLQPWNDEMFEQGVVGEDPPYMMELWPNAFRDVYGGKRGYLYTLAPDTFYHTNRLTRFEQISDLSPEILNVEVIEDALSALQNSNLQMIYFEDAEAFRMNNYRQNPYIDTDRYGYLLNPQYSQYARRYADRQSRREEGDTTLWVHATEYDVSDWLDPNFKIKGDRFYIGGGANADLFGTNLVFVKYKPTKIFEPDEIEYRADNDFFECVYQELTSLPYEDKDVFINVHARFMDEPIDNLPTFDDLSKPQIIELLKSGLATSNYSFFENSYVQNCLVKFGYTAYYESEGYGGASTAWEDINLAILPADFDNLEIVGVALCTDREKGYYICPNCQDRSCSKKEILAGTFYKGTVLCEDCSKGGECSICDQLTPESSVEIEEYDSWGDRSIICSSCVEDRRCEYCEDFFDPSDIRSAKSTKVRSYGSYVERTIICDECFEENRDDFDEEQDPRP